LVASIDSTNLEARRRVVAGRAGPGLVLVAVHQSAGRGRRDRRWHCVPGRSLAATLVIERPELERLSRVTLLTAVAACRALEARGAPPLQIKWPNDLMRDDSKLAGMLVELVKDPQGRELLLIGIGINLCLRPGDLPEDIAALATDAGLDASDATRDAVLEELVTGLEAALSALGTATDRAWGQEYRSRSWLDGRRVELELDGSRQTVDLAGVTADGDLLLADGRLLQGEHVQLVAVHRPG
jgi:BirA family biotin operon repressor/biotin-[acetyl-CoA-carboxylase] ligase